MATNKVMCMIDDFKFQTYRVGLESIDEQEEYSYSSTQTLASFDDIQAVGQYKTTKTLAGILIKQGADALEPLRVIARKKKPVDYISASSASGKAQKILIHKIGESKTFFLANGVNLKADFTVDIEVLNG